MSFETAVAAVLAVAVVVGWLRLGWWQWRAPARARWWRIAALAVLQPVVGGLLYLILLPPRVDGAAGVLVVATAGAPRLVTTGPGERLVAMPEAAGTAGAEAAPDLGTALRRHPGTRAIRVVGGGLEARDRDAVRGVAVTFAPPTLPRGLVGLYPPGPVAPGAAFQVGAQVSGGGNMVEMWDPAGRLVDRVVPGDDGQAVLGGTARAAGAASFMLRVRGADRAILSEAVVPVVVTAPVATRMLIVAGAPGPEVKFLRRWATDAGLAPVLRTTLGGGVRLGDAPGLTGAVLARTDVAVFDDRGWAALSAGERAAVAAAVRGGMGALLRVTGPLPAGVRAQWRAMGLDVAGGQATAPVVLVPAAPNDDALQARRGPGSAAVLASAAAARDDLPALTRRVVAIGGGVPLLRDARGAVLAGWRQSGRGRVGVWAVEDSFALVTAGHGDRYGEWWGTIASALARPDVRPVVTVDPLPRQGERMTVCDLPAGAAAMIDPAGRRAALVRDPAAGGCAGYWPGAAGWHGVTGGQGLARPVYVHAAAAMPGVRAAGRRDATAALAGGGGSPAAQGVPGERGASWPWLLGWLAAAASLWWLERARIGRPARSAD